MKRGFTLIELLVVISIIGIVIGISIFGLGNARKSGRDTRRRSDLEEIRSGIEIYRADCGEYPTTGELDFGSSLRANCPDNNTYISSVPEDPIPGQQYVYRSNGVTYEICAHLENGTGSVNCMGASNCGGTGGCNYKVTNP